MLCLTGSAARLVVGDREVDTDLATAMPWVKAPLRATWFSGSLRCPDGRLITYAYHMFGSVYERDRLFHIERGRMVEENVTLNPPDEITHRIAPDGSRSCIPARWADIEIPDPLEGRPFSDAHLV